MHHEQAAAFAAEADARVSNQIGVVHVTAGPGVTNTVTGVACAWADSIPMLVIAGQVDSRTMLNGHHPRERQLGVSEVDAVSIMEPITKWAHTVMEPSNIRQALQRATWLAKEGRPGPVFLEIPLNVQAAEIDPIKLVGYREPAAARSNLDDEIHDCVEALADAERPVILLGNGVHLAGAEDEARWLLGLGVPILTSWNASDLVDSNHSGVIGRPGLIGDRAGNFAIQNADVILAIGTRLTIPMIGHSPELFAPNAKIIMVDVDEVEIDKSTLHVEQPIVADAKEFLERFVPALRNVSIARWDEWRLQCREWKRQYPVVLPEYRDNQDGVNSYVFIEELAKQIDNDAIIVTDVGTAFVGTMQSMPMTGKQRLFHSSGIAPMGYGLPAAIGAYFASHGKRQIICICGDGGIMFNLQELQTVKHHNLPISIFVLCNDGYLTMQHTQLNHFKRESAASERSGVSCPEFFHVAEAFDIHPDSIAMQQHIGLAIKMALEVCRPTLCSVHMPKGQVLQPRVASRLENGQFVPTDISDLWPHLPREEYERNMSIGAC
jgi:acetolactate synthase-1/2/3 large subunit